MKSGNFTITMESVEDRAFMMRVSGKTSRAMILTVLSQSLAEMCKKTGLTKEQALEMYSVTLDMMYGNKLEGTSIDMSTSDTDKAEEYNGILDRLADSFRRER
jgi:hypothetical protein